MYKIGNYFVLVNPIQNNINGSPRFNVRVFQDLGNSEHLFECQLKKGIFRVSRGGKGYIYSGYRSQLDIAKKAVEEVECNE